MFDWKLKIWKIMQTHIASLIVCFQMCEGTTAEELSFNCWQYNTFTVAWPCFLAAWLCLFWVSVSVLIELFLASADGCFRWREPLRADCSLPVQLQTADRNRCPQVEKKALIGLIASFGLQAALSQTIYTVSGGSDFCQALAGKMPHSTIFPLRVVFFSPYLSVNIEQNGSENENNTIWSQRPFCYDFHTKALDCVTSCVYCPNARSSSSTYSWVNNSEWHGVAFSRPTEHSLSKSSRGCVNSRALHYWWGWNETRCWLTEAHTFEIRLFLMLCHICMWHLHCTESYT